MEIIRFVETNRLIGQEKTAGFVIQLRPIIDSLPIVLLDMICEYYPAEVCVLISSFQSCCEVWGYCLEDPQYPIANPAEESVNVLLGKRLIGCRLQSVQWGRDREADDKDCMIAVVEIAASRGRSVNILLYNTHNGYYPHEVYLDRFGDLDKQTI